MSKSKLTFFSYTWKHLVILAFRKYSPKSVLLLQGLSLMGERMRSRNSCSFSCKPAETWSVLSIQISKCTEIYPYQHSSQIIKFKPPFVITLLNSITYFLSPLPSPHRLGCQCEHPLNGDFSLFIAIIFSTVILIDKLSSFIWSCVRKKFAVLNDVEACKTLHATIPQWRYRYLNLLQDNPFFQIGKDKCIPSCGSSAVSHHDLYLVYTLAVPSHTASRTLILLFR